MSRFWPLLLLALLVLLEAWRPGFPLVGRSRTRWQNLGVGLVNAVLVRALLPAGLATWSSLALELGPRPAWPLWAGLLLLDLALYVQHWALHRVPWLWRLHAPHHADAALDASTGLRFHPLEALASAAWKGLVILLAGLEVDIVVLYESLLLACSLFSHANVPWRGRMVRLLDGLWMTPAVHRCHHSQETAGQRTNLGPTCLLWDRLFGTYQRPGGPVLVGLPLFRGSEPDFRRGFLFLPFIIKKL